MDLSSAMGGGLLDLASTWWQTDQAKKESKRTRDFQEEMSSTAYQRAADDLEAAGLNRILAYGNPAATPSGAMAAIDNPRLGGAVQTGINAASAKQQIEQSKATEGLQKEQVNTERMRQHLLKEQTIQSATQSNLNSASAQLNSAKAVKEATFNPIHKLGNEVLEKLSNYGRSSARAYQDAANDARVRPGKNSPTFKQIERKYRK